jgi:negative regulator of sigma E activity
MHNCKVTRSSLIELAMNELPAARAGEMLSELKDCANCQEEYFSLRSVLRVSEQALESTLPEESFWSGYHARLSSRLENLSAADQQVHLRPSLPTALTLASRLWAALRQIVTASVRIPVPVAAALVLLAAVFGFFALRSRGQVIVNSAPPAPTVITRTIEVPVVQEKVVTRVVYLERARRRSPASGESAERGDSPNLAKRVADPGANAEGTTAMSLIGFKPTEQVKLKVVKGSYRDEK